MEQWKEYRLGEIGKIITGKTPRTAIKGNYGGTIPFLTPSDDMTCKFVAHTKKTLTSLGLAEVKNCLLPENSICVSCIGSDLGKVVKIKKPTVTNQQINSIIPYEAFDADFVYYLMCIVGKDLNIISKTSTAVPIINKSSFSNYKVRIPKIDIQKTIGCILSSLDDKIELNRKINSNLECSTSISPDISLGSSVSRRADNHIEDSESKRISANIGLIIMLNLSHTSCVGKGTIIFCMLCWLIFPWTAPVTIELTFVRSKRHQSISVEYPFFPCITCA